LGRFFEIFFKATQKRR